MGLIGEVVNGEPDPVEQAFLPGQQSGKFEIVGEEFRKGDSRDMTGIFRTERPSAEAVDFLHSVKRNRCGHLMRVDEIKELLYRRESAGLGLRVFAEEVYGNDGGVQVYSQWANSFTSFSGCSAMSKMMCERAMERTAKPWSFRRWALSARASRAALTISNFLSFSDCFFVSFMCGTPCVCRDTGRNRNVFPIINIGLRIMHYHNYIIITLIGKSIFDRHMHHVCRYVNSLIRDLPPPFTDRSFFHGNSRLRTQNSKLSFSLISLIVSSQPVFKSYWGIKPSSF